MGISEFRQIKERHIVCDNLSDLDTYVNKKVKVNVYIDGPLYLYIGCVNSNIDLDDCTTYNSLKVAESAAAFIYNTVAKIQKYRKILNVYVYFDGKRPAAKMATVKKRLREFKCKMEDGEEIYLEKKISLDVKEATFHLCNILNTHNYLMCNLEIGESEHEMITHRNVNFPSIILTDDSDAFHIAYGYEDMTCNDYIFICTRKLQQMYNIHKLQKELRMPKAAFALLCFLRGSDFTTSTFTSTMVNVILEEFKNPLNKIVKSMCNQLLTFSRSERNIAMKNQASPPIIKNNYNQNNTEIEPVYTERDVIDMIRSFLLILLRSKKQFRWNSFDKSIYCDHMDVAISAIQEHVKCLTWALNYSLIGCKFSEYNEPVNMPPKIEHFLFYHLVLDQEYDVLIYGINHFETYDYEAFKPLVLNYHEDF
ncbi:FEN-1 [Penaeus vannamei nudivirus]|nr:hypothetical protein PvSNPV_012 [Penaeus vannamei nucleopolyhedrovirus]